VTLTTAELEQLIYLCRESSELDLSQHLAQSLTTEMLTRLIYISVYQVCQDGSTPCVYVEAFTLDPSDWHEIDIIYETVVKLANHWDIVDVCTVDSLRTALHAPDNYIIMRSYRWNGMFYMTVGREPASPYATKSAAIEAQGWTTNIDYWRLATKEDNNNE
jgi:hypothetical protein